MAEESDFAAEIVFGDAAVLHSSYMSTYPYFIVNIYLSDDANIKHVFVTKFFKIVFQIAKLATQIVVCIYICEQEEYSSKVVNCHT